MWEHVNTSKITGRLKSRHKLSTIVISENLNSTGSIFSLVERGPYTVHYIYYTILRYGSSGQIFVPRFSKKNSFGSNSDI